MRRLLLLTLNVLVALPAVAAGPTRSGLAPATGSAMGVGDRMDVCRVATAVVHDVRALVALHHAVSALAAVDRGLAYPAPGDAARPAQVVSLRGVDPEAEAR